jgi:hypothetical protein
MKKRHDLLAIILVSILNPVTFDLVSPKANYALQLNESGITKNYQVVHSYLRVRAKPNTSSPVVKTLHEGDTIQGISQGDWIKFPDGWILNNPKYISENTNESGTTKNYQVVHSYLRVRAKPNTSSLVVKTLHEGDTIQGISQGDWIKFPDGWILNNPKYISENNNDTVPKQKLISTNIIAQQSLTTNNTELVNGSNGNLKIFLFSLFSCFTIATFAFAFNSRRKILSNLNKAQTLQLITELNNRKYDAINHYEHDIDQFIERVREVSMSRKEKTKKIVLEKLNKSSFAGFGQKKKIDDFYKLTLEKIHSSEWESFQGELRNLGENFYKSEEKLQNGLQEILTTLSSECKKIRAPKPDLQTFNLQQSNYQLPFSDGNLGNYYNIGAGAVLSAGCALGFFPPDATASTIVHGTSGTVVHGSSGIVVHGTAIPIGHTAGHTVSHAASHAAGHAAGQTAGHTLGWFIPGLQIVLIGYSAFCIGKFLFDDAEVKEKIYDDVSQNLDKLYRLIIEGDNEKLGLDGQLRHIKSEFRKNKEALFDKSIQPTMEGILKHLEQAL